MSTLERLTIYVGESDQWQGKPTYLALVEAARQRGLAGATVTRGIAGFGAHQRIHTSRILELSSDLPMVVTIIDGTDEIAAFLPLVREMVKGGIALQETVNVVDLSDSSHPSNSI
jgi:PII-like signaling protein